MPFDEKLEAFRGRCGFRQAKWPYFQSLLFLKDQFIPRRSTSNLASTSSCANPSPLGTDSSEDVDDWPDSEVAPIPGSSQGVPIASWFWLVHAAIVNFESTYCFIFRQKKEKATWFLNVETKKLRLLHNKKKAPIEKPLDEDRC
jgi:hypothetical protein